MQVRILYHHRTQGKFAEGVHIREVVNALCALGHEVFVVSPPGIDPFQIAQQVGRSSLSSVWSLVSKYMPQGIFELFELSYNIAAYRSMKKIIEKQHVDCIYERYAFFNYAGASIAQEYNLPFILEINEISGIKRQRGQTFVGLAGRVERKVCTSAGGIFVVSQYLKEKIVEKGITAEKIHVLPNAVNINQFNPEIPGDEVRTRWGLTGKIVIGFVGNFSSWDRLDFLIEEFAEVCKSHEDVRLLVVGDGACRPQLEDVVRRRGLSGRVNFTGKVSRADVPRYLAAMDIGVIPHSNPFGSPMVLFEFMAMGKPVVAPRLGPIEQIIKDNINGVIFEPEYVHSFRNRLIELFEDSRKRTEIGRQARAEVLGKYTWQKNAEKIQETFKRMIA